MRLNYLRLTRISTNLTLLTFLGFVVGLIFTIADEVLDWDILPDLIEKYAQLIVVSFGIFSSLFIISSIVCSLTTIAELTAYKINGQQADSTLSRRKKMILGIIITTVIIAFFVFQEIDVYRKQEIFARDAEKFAQRLDRNTKQLEEALTEVLLSFPEALLQKISDQTVLETTDELKDFLVAVSLAIPDHPQVALLMCADDPYNYFVISVIKKYDYQNEVNQYQLHKQPYISFSKDSENQVVKNLFKENLQPLTKPLKGDFIDNTEPSSWGVLKSDGQVVAILLLKEPIEGYYFKNLRKRKAFNHTGPVKVHSNF
jgi:heme/copper-type cytochrome/quinol oxidase subunit 2